MLNEKGFLVFGGLTYPYNPVSAEPWTAETAEAFVRENTPDAGSNPEPIPVHRPIRISRIDFTRRFTGTQQAKINAFRKACAALTSEDYANPSAGLLIQLEIVFQQFDLPAEFIELDHEDTRLGMELLGYAGIFGEDPEVIASEIERVLETT